MKRAFALLAALLISLTLCSCDQKTPAAALTVSGAKINEEIFLYYADKVASRPSDYGIEGDPSVNAIKIAAEELCKRYVVGNTAFSDMGISLSAAEKTQVSQTVNDLWVRFENHYKKIGVSKQTLSKITTAEAYENKVFTVTYDKGTGNAESEKILTDHFYSNYVSFRTVCAYFTSADGKTQVSQQKKADIMADMDTISKQTADGIDGFITAAQEKGYSVSDSVIIKKDAEGYPEGFFDSISAQTAGTVRIIEYEECVFAVYKEDLKSKGESVYANYRSACITDLYYAEYDANVKSCIDGLEVKESGGINSLVKKVSK